MDADVVLPDLVDESPKPWGVWATLGFSLLVYIVFQFVQTVVIVVYARVAAGIRTPAEIEGFETNGMALSLASWTSLPFVLGSIVLLVKLRGWSARDYLAMRRVSGKTLLAWLGLALLLEGILAILSANSHRSQTDFVIQVYKTAGSLPFLWATLLVAAPLFEELLFRGFMFQGIQRSRLGDPRRDRADGAGVHRHAHPVRCPSACRNLCIWPSLGSGSPHIRFCVYDNGHACIGQSYFSPSGAYVRCVGKVDARRRPWRFSRRQPST